MSENLVEKYATKTYSDKDYKDIVVSEKSFVNLVQENNKQKEVLDKIKEYIKENTRYYDKELGLVEMMGAGKTRTPVIYLYGLLELLEEIE